MQGEDVKLAGVPDAQPGRSQVQSTLTVRKATSALLLLHSCSTSALLLLHPIHRQELQQLGPGLAGGDGGRLLQLVASRAAQKGPKKEGGGGRKKKKKSRKELMLGCLGPSATTKKKYNTGFLKCKNRSQKRHVLMN